jgi:hypothetical protein
MSAPKLDTVAKLVAETPGAHWVPTEQSDGTVALGAWVPYGPGFEIPLSAEYGGGPSFGSGGPFDWRLLYGVIDGRPQCIRLECSNAGAPVTPEALHRFPLGRLLEEAVLMASRPVDEIPRSFVRWESIEQVRAEREAVAAHHAKRPNGRRRKVLTDEFLGEVAEVYRQHVATGKPSKAVEEHFHYKPASARRVVREARQRGFLGQARPGRGGEQVQPKEGDDG